MDAIRNFFINGWVHSGLKFNFMVLIPKTLNAILLRISGLLC